MTEWTYEFSQQARDDLRSLPDDISQRVVEKIKQIVTDEWRHPQD